MKLGFRTSDQEQLHQSRLEHYDLTQAHEIIKIEAVVLCYKNFSPRLTYIADELGIKGVEIE